MEKYENHILGEFWEILDSLVLSKIQLVILISGCLPENKKKLAEERKRIIPGIHLSPNPLLIYGADVRDREIADR